MILILGGTVDTHRAVELMKDEEFLISVATDYGYSLFNEKYPNKVVKKKFDKTTLTRFIAENSVVEIVDTTHPYAKEISKTAKDVARALNIKYVQKKRDFLDEDKVSYDKAVFVDNVNEALTFLKSNCSTILFSIGSKKLNYFKEFRDSSYFRILPFEESIKKCREIGIDYTRIIAMQGPFSENIDKVFIEEFGIDCVVSKNSGKEGGLLEKIEAARRTGIYIVIIGSI